MHLMYSWHPRKSAITTQNKKNLQVPWKPTAKLIKSSWNNNIFPRALARPVNNRGPDKPPIFAGYCSYPWGHYITLWFLSPGHSTAGCSFLWSLPGLFLKWPHICHRTRSLCLLYFLFPLIRSHLITSSMEEQLYSEGMEQDQQTTPMLQNILTTWDNLQQQGTCKLSVSRVCYC